MSQTPRGPLPRPPVQLKDNRYASPADIIHALLAEGWNWYELPKGQRHKRLDLIPQTDMLVLVRDNFEYVVNPLALTWTIVLNMMQDYGYFIAKEYIKAFGVQALEEHVH